MSSLKEIMYSPKEKNIEKLKVYLDKQNLTNVSHIIDIQEDD